LKAEREAAKVAAAKAAAKAEEEAKKAMAAKRAAAKAERGDAAISTGSIDPLPPANQTCSPSPGGRGSTVSKPAVSAAAPAKATPATSANDRNRRMKLREVFKVFDFDNTKSLESSELLELGRARRSMGQKKGEWTEEMNARLVKKMDLNLDGKVDEFEFAKHFEQALPRGEGKFNTIIRQFTEVANACKERKEKAKARSQTPSVQKPAAAVVVPAPKAATAKGPTQQPKPETAEDRMLARMNQTDKSSARASSPAPGSRGSTLTAPARVTRSKTPPIQKPAAPAAAAKAAAGSRGSMVTSEPGKAKVTSKPRSRSVSPVKKSEDKDAALKAEQLKAKRAEIEATKAADAKAAEAKAKAAAKAEEEAKKAKAALKAEREAAKVAAAKAAAKAEEEAKKAMAAKRAAAKAEREVDKRKAETANPSVRPGGRGSTLSAPAVNRPDVTKASPQARNTVPAQKSSEDKIPAVFHETKSSDAPPRPGTRGSTLSPPGRKGRVSSAAGTRAPREAKPLSDAAADNLLARGQGVSMAPSQEQQARNLLGKTTKREPRGIASEAESKMLDRVSGDGGKAAAAPRDRTSTPPPASKNPGRRKSVSVLPGGGGGGELLGGGFYSKGSAAAPKAAKPAQSQAEFKAERAAVKAAEAKACLKAEEAAKAELKAKRDAVKAAAAQSSTRGNSRVLDSKPDTSREEPELTPRTNNLFKKVDVNGDGVIDASEFKEAMRAGTISPGRPIGPSTDAMKLEDLSGGKEQGAFNSPKEQQAARVQAAEDKVKKHNKATQRIADRLRSDCEAATRLAAEKRKREAEAASKLAEVKKQRDAAATAKIAEDLKLERQQRKAANQPRTAAAVNKPPSPRNTVHATEVATTQRVSQSQQQSEKDRRAEALWMVFKMFDLDQSGTLTSEELLRLGQKRRELGQVGGEWDEASNNQLVAELGGGEDGIVTGENFVEYFGVILVSLSSEDFDAAIEQFRQVAKACQRASAREEHERRNEALRAVFHLFDLDNDSTIDKDELLQLGQARRKLSQANGTWDESKNAAMMKKMSGGNGRIHEENFMDYYLSVLSDTSGQEFDETMIQFKLVARECRLAHADSTGEDEPEEQVVPDDVNLTRSLSPSSRLLDSR